MSVNPYFLELMAKERQRELLALAQPKVVPVDPGRRKGLGALRQGFAGWLIQLGLRLKNRGSSPVCPLSQGADAVVAAGPVWRCACPRRGDFAACPPLHSG
jgi:hypothetical protein